MNKLKFKSLIKVTFITLLIITFIALTTRVFKTNIIYQLSVLITAIIYYFIINREKLKNLLDLFKFIVIMIFIIHTIFFIFKIIFKDLDYAINFYTTRWENILIRAFVIPNIFAFIDILTSRISFVDIVVLSNNNPKVRAVYIILISGIEVMERLRIYFEYHPHNYEKGIKNIYHYLAVPLALFFGINKKFESKIKSLKERDEYIRSNI